jgi:hypothetical protein
LLIRMPRLQGPAGSWHITIPEGEVMLTSVCNHVLAAGIVDAGGYRAREMRVVLPVGI